MSVLICFALKEEAAPFTKVAAGKPGVALLLTGIGRRNAEKSAREFLAGNSPALVLTCGFAGGLNPDLKPGDIVFELSEPQLPSSISHLRTQLLAAGAKPATFFCASRVAVTAAEKKKLRAETGADAVEMESAAIHAVCRELGIPGATVRVISDPAGEDLPMDFNALARPDLSLDYGKLAWAMAKAPGKIGGLLKLQKQTRFAAERLADILEKIIC
jgi:adenosylhomocysteine nucleosidase